MACVSVAGMVFWIHHHVVDIGGIVPVYTAGRIFRRSGRAIHRRDDATKFFGLHNPSMTAGAPAAVWLKVARVSSCAALPWS